MALKPQRARVAAQDAPCKFNDSNPHNSYMMHYIMHHMWSILQGSGIASYLMLKLGPGKTGQSRPSRIIVIADLYDCPSNPLQFDTVDTNTQGAIKRMWWNTLDLSCCNCPNYKGMMYIPVDISEYDTRHAEYVNALMFFETSSRPFKMLQVVLDEALELLIGKVSSCTIWSCSRGAFPDCATYALWHSGLRQLHIELILPSWFICMHGC